ncbi:hypothetical protein K450DRAFT_248675 [Umbelopsis ramanniana AG]|uniref:Uncharacterized protein n=1 Tax=Umbelopsis ramanniana AG TaxID=1314678 RepID=A0AAD5E8D4_UMBRA|nr:uncharacterized protein K450DRAFT_248675 [Umbelopsis ramanniana AG]KAI8578210.1 hypothetical protein K450DRAFT_248675 [Umbelopsis ramanniana AG]
MESQQLDRNGESHLSHQKGRLNITVGDQKADLLNMMSTIAPSNRKMGLSFLPRIATIVIFEIGLPLGLYFGLRQPTGPLSPVWALLVAGCPPLLVVIYSFVVNFKIDGAGLLLVTGFVVAAIVAVVSQNAKVLLLEKSIVTGAIGVVFLITLIPFRLTWKGKLYRMLPLTYTLCLQFLPADLTYDVQEVQCADTSFVQIQRASQPHDEEEDRIQMAEFTSSGSVLPGNTEGQMIAAQQQSPRKKFNFGFQSVELPLFRFMYYELPTFRLLCILITLVWGVGFLIELAIRLVLIFTMSDFDRIFLLSNIIFIVALVICAVSTSAISLVCHFRCIREMKQYLDQGPR